MPTKLKRTQSFLGNLAEKGGLLLIASLLAIVVANSTLYSHYQDFFNSDLGWSFGEYKFQMPILHWINDLLMALFFLCVGMEIKRELVTGYLSHANQRLLPLLSAAAGVTVPLLIYILVNHRHPSHMSGWAIPGATDIAFTLGVMKLFGRNVPVALRVFVTALAIIDDLIAVCIIAIFYTEQLSMYYLLAAIIIAMLLFCYAGSRRYLLSVSLGGGLIMWYCTYSSGIHPTVSGVVLGLVMPITTKNGQTPMLYLEKRLSPLNNYFILPLFAFANSGLSLPHEDSSTLWHPITLGIALGLFVGKQLGIMLAALLLRFCGKLKLPDETSLPQFYGAAVLCGIGFTMSLFIATISFCAQPKLLSQAQLGVFLGSVCSALYGAMLFKLRLR